jgi:hypothetical protein
VQTPADDDVFAARNRFRWLGLAGSVALAVGGLGAGALPRPDPWTDVPVLRLLRHGAGPDLCIALAAVGMAVLLFAWWRSRPGADAEPGWWTKTAAWWALPLALTPPLFSRDLYIYAGQGLVLARGLDPYQVGPADVSSGPGADWVTSLSPTWTHTPAPYGPLFLFFSSRIVSLAHGNLLVAVGLFRVLAVLGILALALIIPRLARAYDADPARAQWLVTVNPFLLAHLIGGSHNEALMLPLLAAALLLAAPSPQSAFRRVMARGIAAGALAGLAAAVKVSAVVAIPFLVLLVTTGLLSATGLAAVTGFWNRLARLLRAGAAVIGGGVVAFVLASAAAGLGPGFLHGFAVTGGISVQWTSIPTGWGLAGGWVADRLGHPAAKAGILADARSLGTVVAAVLLVVIWWRVRFAPAPKVVRACGVALLVVVVLGESVHPWYLLWGLIPLALVRGRLAERLAVVLTVLCFLVLPDGYNLARSTVVPGSLFDLALTIAAIWYGVHWLRRRRTETPTLETAGAMR